MNTVEEDQRAATTILVVEDEENIRNVVVKALKRDGHRVLEASNPWEAAEVMGCGLFDVDVLFADVIMPGMSGTEFAQEMRQMQPRLKIVFATGCSQAEVRDMTALVEQGYFLQKPYTVDQLREAVRVTLAV